MTAILCSLLIAGGLSVRTANIDTCYDWLVSGRIQSKHLSVDAEKERENGTLYTNYEASTQFKYVRASVIENTAKKIYLKGNSKVIRKLSSSRI